MSELFFHFENKRVEIEHLDLPLLRGVEGYTHGINSPSRQPCTRDKTVTQR